MVINKRIELEFFLFLLFGIAVGAFFVARIKQAPLQTFQTLPITVVSPTPTPTISFFPTIMTESQISSDGTKKVTMQVTTNQNTTRTYKVSTDDNESIFFRKTLAPGENISIPYNTWDPQDKYFFLQEKTKNGTKVMVFNATGEPFADGETYLDLTDAYAKRATGYTFDVATGWGGYNLIVINTKLHDNTQGPSYWFEVPSKNIIQLSAQF